MTTQSRLKRETGVDALSPSDSETEQPATRPDSRIASPGNQLGADEATFDAFCRGEAEAVTRVRGWVEGVVGFGNWRFRDPEGVVQEVLLKLVRLVRSESFSKRSSFKTFACSVAKFTCVDVYRFEGRRREETLDPTDTLPPSPTTTKASTAEAAERRDLVRYILQRLPDDCVRLWHLIYRESLTAAEAGERLGIKEGTVRVRVHRCLQGARRVGQVLQEEGWRLR